MSNRRSFLRGASVLMGHAAFGQVMTASGGKANPQLVNELQQNILGL